MTAPSPISIPLSTLLSADSSSASQAQDAISQAFGSGAGSLGVIVITDLSPAFPSLREKLFHLIHRFASLPEAQRELLARESSSYSFGWSHGKEVMNGKPDTQKGSFYANPLLDHPNVDDEKRAAYPEYYEGNVWPDEGFDGMAEFEETFKALGRLIYNVGIALAKACEPFVASVANESTPSTRPASIEQIISSSQANKARLLHYYPLPPLTEGETSEEALDSFCGTHIDHSLLTGLCSALYLASPDTANSAEYTQPRAVPAPDADAGLYIYPRQATSPVKVSIPADCLAFQIGEALEILTDGRLAATPHFVRGSSAPAPSSSSSLQVSRETFAFFLQPDVDDIISPRGETFGAFTKRVLERHYSELVPAKS